MKNSSKAMKAPVPVGAQAAEEMPLKRAVEKKKVAPTKASQRKHVEAARETIGANGGQMGSKTTVPILLRAAVAGTEGRVNGGINGVNDLVSLFHF